ncbi:hypothetical protein Q8F55_000232 [Vanrija albida]|uniref:2Fe-2S ferredoxin-type domain-containing protein n=1 Tax=Vanrija albida TaxID=181172 RepID=A0ABR3QD92_9TREE
MLPTALRRGLGARLPRLLGASTAPAAPARRPSPRRAVSSSPSAAARRPIALDLPPPPEPPISAPEADTPPPLPRAINPRRALLLLSIPQPPSTWPSHLDTLSPLLQATGLKLKRAGVAVNAVYDGSGNAPFPALGQRERYPARLLYADGRAFAFPHFDAGTLATPAWAEAVTYEPAFSPVPNALAYAGDAEVLVCTHASRDCRCGDQGRPLVASLREAAAARGLRVPVREVAHVGGHKWAANAVLLPSLDMLSNLVAADAPALLDFVEGNRAPGAMWAHWRGRFGLSEGQQAEVWAAVSGPEIKPAAEAEGEKVRLRFRTFEGELRDVEAPLGASLLAVGKEHDLPALEGTCGGNLECATCHLYLKPTPTPAPVPPPTDDELDMLGYAISYRDGQSRLGCQVKVTPELAKWVADGGVIDLPRF